MPIANYTQWVIPFAIQTGGRNSGRRVKITINRDNFDFNIAATDQFILSPSVFTVKEIAPQIMEYSEDDALVTVDLSELRLLDVYKFRGTVNGVDSGWLDLEPEGKTLIWKHICDADRLTIWKSIENGSTWEHRFCGDINPRELERKHFKVLYENTADENPLSLIKFPIKSMWDRLKETTVRDFIRDVTTAELVTNSGTPYPFYGGLQTISKQDRYPLSLPSVADKFSNYNEAINDDNYSISRLYGIFNVNTGTDKISTRNVTPFANDEQVAFVASGTGTLPAPLTSRTIYYVVNRTATDFQVSATMGGSAINLTTTGSYVNKNIYVGSVDNTTPLDKSVFFKHFAYTGKLSNISVFPSGMWGMSIDSVISVICNLPGIDYLYTTPSADEHSFAFTQAIWDTDRYTVLFDDPVSTIDTLICNWNGIFSVSPNYGLAIDSVNTATDTLTVSDWVPNLGPDDIDPFANGDIVHVRISDTGATVPAGLETYKDYYVINGTRASDTTFTFKLSESLDGVAVDITSTGSGAQYVGNFYNKTPGSYEWNTPLAEVLKDICIQFGFVLEFDVTQSGGDEGKPILKLSRRRYTVGTIPTSWSLLNESSSEKRQESRARAVRVGYIADQDNILCPTNNEKDYYDVGLRFRIHPWSNDAGVVQHTNLIYDRNKTLYEQSPTWWSPAENELGFDLQADGWLGANGLFQEKTDTSNTNFPPAWDNDALDLADTGTDYSGFYILNKVRYRDQEIQFDSYPKLMALYLANELLHPDEVIEIERTYGGIVDDSGSILTIKPRMTVTIGDRTFRAIRIEQNEVENTTKVKFRPVPTNVDELDFTLPLFEGRNGTGSSGGGGGGGGARTSTGTDENVGLPLLVQPETPLRNKTNPKGAETHSLDIGNNEDFEKTELGFYDLGEVKRVALVAPDALTEDVTYALPQSPPTVDGAILTGNIPVSGVSETNWSTSLRATDLAIGFYGDITFDGSSTVAGLTPAASVYTMTADIDAENIQVDAGVTIETSGFRIACKDTLHTDSTAVIECDGNDAVVQTGGAATNNTGPLGRGAAGGNGATGPANGNNGSNSSNGVTDSAGGGQGGDDGINTGGAPGANNPAAADYGAKLTYAQILTRLSGLIFGPTSGIGKVGGGVGGGGGAALLGGIGGGGGGGGGVVHISAGHINNEGDIRARGGNGADGSATSAGGGGGGQGGTIYLTYHTFEGNAADVSGGLGGAGTGTGDAGTDGADGLVIESVL